MEKIKQRGMTATRHPRMPNGDPTCLYNDGTCWVDPDGPEFGCFGVDVCEEGRRITQEDLGEAKDLLTELVEAGMAVTPDRQVEPIHWRRFEQALAKAEEAIGEGESP